VESLVKQHLYKQVILSKHRMRAIILTDINQLIEYWT